MLFIFAEKLESRTYSALEKNYAPVINLRSELIIRWMYRHKQRTYAKS